MGDVTDEELVQIATNFLINAPPGEFMEVVTDVRALLPNESLLNASAPETFKKYNTEQMLQVNSPNSSHKHQVLITSHGEVGENEYIDARGSQVVTFDHIKQEITGTRPISGELDAAVEPCRNIFDDEAAKYVAEHYPTGTSAVYAKQEGGKHKVIVCISSSKFNPTNFWNGRWRSTWTVEYAPGNANISIHGKLNVNVHYYEDGNVQLNTSSEKRITAQGGDPATTATNAIKAIIKSEQAFHDSLNSSYTTMGDTTFKALRRALPITRTKIDWAKILSYKLSQDMSKS